ncbi:hypothetical protein CEP53_003985 [Fusarium sp. AF-6]|nr:hypothetical protein CEP53_003985 [Fusarium sp. AF-6]
MNNTGSGNFSVTNNYNYGGGGRGGGQGGSTTGAEVSKRQKKRIARTAAGSNPPQQVAPVPIPRILARRTLSQPRARILAGNGEGEYSPGEGGGGENTRQQDALPTPGENTRRERGGRILASRTRRENTRRQNAQPKNTRQEDDPL